MRLTSAITTSCVSKYLVEKVFYHRRLFLNKKINRVSQKTKRSYVQDDTFYINFVCFFVINVNTLVIYTLRVRTYRKSCAKQKYSDRKKIQWQAGDKLSRHEKNYRKHYKDFAPKKCINISLINHIRNSILQIQESYHRGLLIIDHDQKRDREHNQSHKIFFPISFLIKAILIHRAYCYKKQEARIKHNEIFQKCTIDSKKKTYNGQEVKSTVDNFLFHFGFNHIKSPALAIQILYQFLSINNNVRSNIQSKQAARFLSLPLLSCCYFASAHIPLCTGLLIRVVGWHRPSQGRKFLTLNMMVSKHALALWDAVKKYTASSFLIPKIEVAK